MKVYTERDNYTNTYCVSCVTQNKGRVTIGTFKTYEEMAKWLTDNGFTKLPAGNIWKR